MAVERLTDYTRRIWTGLSADGPDPDMQVGDVIYYMDTSTCSIITGIPAPGSIDTVDLPDLGGGGGPVLQTWKVTFNKGSTPYAARVYSILNDEKTAISRYKSLTQNTSTEYYIPAVANTAQNGGYVIQLMLAGQSVTSLVNATEVAVDTNNNNIHYIRVTADNAVINLP